MTDYYCVKSLCPRFSPVAAISTVARLGFSGLRSVDRLHVEKGRLAKQFYCSSLVGRWRTKVDLCPEMENLAETGESSELIKGARTRGMRMAADHGVFWERA